jgi:hypothetical protein
MAASLYDITIYFGDTKQKDASDNWLFSRAANFICDFYHQKLFGYKPPRTTRITIILTASESDYKPSFIGSICGIARLIDEDAFLRFSETDRYKFLLDLVHGSCMELAEQFGWNKEPFERAYREILESNFSFFVDYPKKQSKDRKKTAHVQVRKTESTSTLYLIFDLENETKKVRLFDKKNRFWSDIVYEMAKNAKWLDNFTFGVKATRSKRFGYYSLAKGDIDGSLDFQITDL